MQEVDKTAILLTGGFDPVHGGHINMFINAKQLFDTVIVGVNSDQWLKRKKLKDSFMDLETRIKVLDSMSFIDKVITFKDSEGHAINAIEKAKAEFSNLVFGNGGDRLPTNTPELKYCLDNNIPIIFNVGGRKTQSSSELLKKYEK